MAVIEGWVHLPAPAESLEDHQLGGITHALKKPYARYISESWTNRYGTQKRKLAGIVVPAEDAEIIARILERVIWGEVRSWGVEEVKR